MDEIWIFVIFGFCAPVLVLLLSFLWNVLMASVRIDEEQQKELSEFRDSPDRIEIRGLATTFDPCYMQIRIKNISNADIGNAIAYIEHFELIGDGRGNLVSDRKIAIPTSNQLEKQIQNPSQVVGRFNLDRDAEKDVVPLEIRSTSLGRTFHVQAELESDRRKHVYPFGQGCILKMSLNPGGIKATYKITLTGGGVQTQRIIENEEETHH